MRWPTEANGSAAQDLRPNPHSGGVSLSQAGPTEAAGEDAGLPALAGHLLTRQRESMRAAHRGEDLDVVLMGDGATIGSALGAGSVDA
jgi:hypothetical protein